MKNNGQLVALRSTSRTKRSGGGGVGGGRVAGVSGGGEKALEAAADARL